ncbi:Hint domain-containing protein [Maribius pontilimi]|uniref:Hint domain-containing protein n=1 Tax=Palleronia pontilimi TaxID=1964209 RepID=A0A934II78_9RHOB|nr:Hint domain-containing protein [Palleronia pontilimi]MBJ3762374.1 Hint domain-containing protein [Palleronia pontilimi]
MSHCEPLSIEAVAPLTGVCGTALLRTPTGPRRAENVHVGDLIVTRHNGLQPVRFIWKSVLKDRIADNPDSAAIRIARRGVGPMMPQQTVALAPDQQILVPSYLLSEVAGTGALLKARALAGHADDVWVDRTMDDATFYDFGFDRHEIICVSGLPVASYRPVAARIGDLPADMRDRLVRRYPQLREKRDPFPSCPYETAGDEAYMPSPT